MLANHFLFSHSHARQYTGTRGVVSAVAAVLLLLCLSTLGLAQEQPQWGLPRLDLSAGMHRIDAQVARSLPERQTGLMYRQEMPAHEGMLFVFEEPAIQCFWMKNTPLPLSAAFVADDGRIIDLIDMQAQSTDSHCSSQRVRYVLEMNQGWFAQKGIKAGAKLRGQPFSDK